MSILSNATYNDLRDLIPHVKHKRVMVERFNYASLFIFFYSLCFYGIFNFIGQKRRIYHNLEKFFVILRSVIAGLFIAVFFMNDHVKMFVQKPFSIQEIFEPSNYPVLIILVVYFFVVLSAFFRRRIKLQSYHLNDFKKNVDIFSLNKKSDDKKMSFIKFVLTRVKDYVLYGIKDFNLNDAPFIYLIYVFFYAFFVGLGFSGCRYIGWAELQILQHKIFEILSIKQSLKKLRFGDNKSTVVIFIFFLMTSIGILSRGYLDLHDVKYDNMPATKICDNIFAQSVILMICVELIIPFPVSKLDLVINWLTTFLSYMSFKSYFNSLEI